MDEHASDDLMLLWNRLEEIKDDGGIAQRRVGADQEERDEQEDLEPRRGERLRHGEPEETDGKDEQVGENHQTFCAEALGDGGGQLGTDDGGGELDGGEDDGVRVRDMVAALQRGDGHGGEHDAAEIEGDAAPYLFQYARVVDGETEQRQLRLPRGFAQRRGLVDPSDEKRRRDAHGGSRENDAGKHADAVVPMQDDADGHQ